MGYFKDDHDTSEKVWNGPWIQSSTISDTSFAIIAFCRAGEERNSEIIKAAVKWLKNNQCLDGGWGIEWVGSSERSYITRTCDAMNALLKAGESTESETIQKGMKWLLKAQDLVTEDGGWGWGYELEKI